LRPRISPAEGAVILQACPNGSRLPGEHPALPVTPAQIAHACSDAVATGAAALLNRGIGVDAELFTTTNGPATRIGLEDVLVHPDGTTAQDTADLVRSAIALGA
jgi:uncharacterized protein (DUF849 family)